MANKRLSRKLKWTRLPSINIAADLKKGQIIEIINDQNVIEKVHYIGKSDNYHKFLGEEDFLEMVRTQSVFEKQKYESASNDEFIKQIIEYKEKTRCQNPDCTCKNNNFPHYLFDFDHLEKTTKSFEVTNLICQYKRAITLKTKQKYINLILQEMQKCQLLCVVCHREKSYKEKNGEHIKLRNYDSALSYLGDKNVSAEPVMRINHADIKPIN